MEKKIKMLPPLMPNFLPTEGLRIDELSTNNMRIPVSSLSADEATEYGELMKQTFIKHWRKKMKRHRKN